MKIFKHIFLTILGVVLGLLTLVFGLLNTKKVQNYAKNIIVQELSQKLGTELDIARLYFRPFNTVGLDSLYVLDRDSNKILLVKNISASIDLYELAKKRIVISAARLSDFDIYIAKNSANSELNIQFIIDAFQPKEEKPKGKLEFKINAINLTNGNLYYDIKDKKAQSAKFDANHISISDLNAKLALKSLQNDSLNIQIRRFGFKERSGFEVTNLVGRLVTKDELVSVKGFELLLPDSKIEFEKLDITLPPKIADGDSTTYNTGANREIEFDFILSKSRISPNDIAAFVPELKHFDDVVTIKTQISGTKQNIKMTDLTLAFGDKLRLISNAEIIDWFDEGDTYILAKIDELSSSGKDIEKLTNSFSSKPVSLSKGIINQNHITFQGDLSGYINQLTAFGSLDTDDGIVRTDVVLGFNKKEKVFSFAKGKVYTTGFELGHFLENKDLGHTSFSISVDIDKPLYKDLKGTVNGVVHDFDFKGYKYSNIVLDVDYEKTRTGGTLKIDDENGALTLEGVLDISNKEYPELNVIAKVTDVQLGKLNLVKNMDYSYLSFDMHANFIGSTIDNVEGYISVDSLEFFKDQHIFNQNNILFKASGSPSSYNRRLEIESGLLNGFIEGEYSSLTLLNSFKHTLQLYLPALFPENTKNTLLTNNFKFHFDINNSEQISEILYLPVIVYEPAVINGFYDDNVELFKLEVNTPSIKAGGMKIFSGLLVAENSRDNLTTTIKAKIEGKNKVLNDIEVKLFAKDDAIKSIIDLENSSANRAKGEFSLLAEFDNLGKEEGLLTRISLDESKLLLNNTNWRMEKSTITIDKKLVVVDNFRFHSNNDEQELKINGKYSKHNSSNILKTELKDIDLSYVFETLAIDALKFGGYASGDIFLSSIEEKPYANTKLKVKDFKFNGSELGQLALFSELNDESQEVILDGTITSKENKTTKVDGIIDPVNQSLSIHFDADSIDIGFLHSYAESIFNKVSGRGTGKVHLHGDFSNVTVEGVAQVIDGNIGIKFLNTDYTFSDMVYLREGLIYFNDIEFKDKLGNKAIGTGKIVHDYFRDIMYHIELNADNFLLYNATEDVNPLFFGQVYGSGKGILAGDEQEVNIDINMKTKPNTLVRMNLMDDEISEYSFITYKEPTQEGEETGSLKSASLRPIAAKPDMSINMNFYIDATPDATIELVMDPVGGDVLRGSGQGAMQFVWSSKLAPQLFGTFNVNRGSYNFTFQRIMERKFTILDGSTVQFRGDPFEATLDVNAIYKVTASLSDLDRKLVEDSGQASLPVHCVLNLTGNLKRPNVGLDIDFPTANADVARQIKSYMDTEDMINRQVAYLLLLSKFYTPDMGEVDHPSSEFAVVASATLSSQLSKIISRIDSRWQLGTHIRMSDAELTSTEVELLLSSQLLNDRLLINGNFGYRNDPYLQNDAVVTDIDIEYLLNPSGTWRIKAYNHYNEKFYYLRDKDKLQTQGVGLIYRRDFDKFNELIPFRRKIKSPVNNSDTIHHVLPDSIKKGSDLSSFIKIK